MPTSSILHEKIRLCKNCILNIGGDSGDYVGPTFSGLIRDSLTDLFKDYIVDGSKSGIKHYAIKQASALNMYYECDLATLDNSINIGCNVTNAINKQVFNTKAVAKNNKSFSIENKLYMKDIIFVNNDGDDLVLFDLIECKYKFDFELVSENPNVYSVTGEIELLTDENDLRHDFTNAWELFKHFVTRKSSRQQNQLTLY